MVMPGDGAVGTSGDYERYTIIDGKRYHHIFDVNTGYPVMLSQSAAAFAPTTEEAVVLSKYLFTTGSEHYAANGFSPPGLIVDSNGKIVYSKILELSFSLKLLNK